MCWRNSSEQNSTERAASKDRDCSAIIIPRKMTIPGSMFDPHATFASLGISPELCEALSRSGISRPTRVQSAAIPRLLNGLKIQMNYFEVLRAAEQDHERNLQNSEQAFNENDVEFAASRDEFAHASEPSVGALEFVPPPPSADDADNVLLIGAKTGSVKTLAYLLPFVEVLREYPGTGVKALPLMPSRELRAGAHVLHSNHPGRAAVAGAGGWGVAGCGGLEVGGGVHRDAGGAAQLHAVQRTDRQERQFHCRRRGGHASSPRSKTSSTSRA